MSDRELFEIWIPNDTSETHAVEDRIVGLLEQHNWPMRDVFGVRLSLEEALVNAIKHGNRMAPDKKVYIRCEFAPDEIEVLIEDQGEGFNMADIPDPTEDENLDKPGGRGIMLIKSFMTSMEYNDRGNRLTMRKKLEKEES